MTYRPSLAALLAGFLAVGCSTTLLAQPGDIKGQDVMGDKSRSANDGWSQAPVPREQSAGKDAPNPGGESTKQNANRPVPNAGGHDNSGSDPAETLPTRAPGPSGQNPAAPSK